MQTSVEERLEALMAAHCVGPVEAARIMREEDKNTRPKLRPEDLPTFYKPFKPVAVDFSKVSDHWMRAQADFKKKGPRWASPLYAKALAKDKTRSPQFNHKATLLLTERGMSGPAIAKALGISLRSVRFHQSQPCAALEVERQEIAWRNRVQHREVTKRGRTPLLPEVYLVEQGIVTDPKMVAWLGSEPFRQLRTREKVRRYMADGILSHRQMAKLIGVTRQAIGLHVKNLQGGLFKTEL
jgi:biotin operon repressor